MYVIGPCNISHFCVTYPHPVYKKLKTHGLFPTTLNSGQCLFFFSTAMEFPNSSVMDLPKGWRVQRIERENLFHKY
jgi:hypothetical protein